MQLTSHFALNELLVSQTASRKGLPNVPTPEIVKSLQLLCQAVLEPVRVHYGRPVIVMSGFRAPAVNKAVGGAKNSDHLYGFAADFTVARASNLEVCKWIAENLDFRQLIYEFGEGGWIHCSYNPRDLKGECLSAKKINGRTKYLPGLK